MTTYRNLWMFPRNKRRVVPLDTAVMLRALIIASKQGQSWFGEQGNQDDFARLLEKYNLKAGGPKVDKKNGGPRTYQSQFQCLGLISKRGPDEIIFTQSGEDMAYFDNVGETLRYQVLKLQYPSEYAQSTGVNINPEIKIRPNVFLMLLAIDEEIDGLSDQDIMVPVVFGKNKNSFAECKEKILHSRKFGIEKVINNVEELVTARTKSKDLNSRLKEVKNVANTFANVLIGVGLCERAQRGNETRIFLRNQYLELLNEVAMLDLVDIQQDNIEQSSRQIGKRRGASKDTRRTLIPNVNLELVHKSEYILQRFFEYAKFPVVQEEIRIFSKRLESELGVDEKFVLSSIAPILNNPKSYINSELVSLSQSSNKGALAFEDALYRVFKDEFKFNASLTGQLKRKEGVGGFSDIFVFQNERNECGIIDAKAIKNYELPHPDVAKMLSTYIPSVNELFPSGRKLNLSFVAYVSHLFKSGAEDRAIEINRRTNLPVVLCSVYGLNNLREDENFYHKPDNVVKLFTSKPVLHLTR